MESRQKKIKDLSFDNFAGNINIKKLWKRISQFDDEYQIVLLPDSHIKDNLESPSSAAVIVKKGYSLHLSSPSPNCGMALLKTNLTKEQLFNNDFIALFIKKFNEKAPLYPKENKLSSSEVTSIFQSGIETLINKYELDNSILDNFELKGNVFNEVSIDKEKLRHTLPQSLIELSRKHFGVLGGGNHFLEFQEISHIYDSQKAEQFNIEKGQILIMFHTGSEAIGSLIGRIYANRLKNSIKSRLKILPFKVKFHLKYTNALKTKLKYFSPKYPVFFNEEDEEFDDAISAYYAAFNFGYANRLYIINVLKEIISSFSPKNNKLDLIYDLSHNSIFKENIDDEEYWIHRHNSCRAFPAEKMKHTIFSQTGQPLILPGTNQTSSYLATAAANAQKTFYTVDHGFGKITSKYQEYNKLCEIPMKKRRIINYTDGNEIYMPALSDQAGEDALNLFKDKGIITPVAKMEPLLTFKGPKPKYF